MSCVIAMHVCVQERGYIRFWSDGLTAWLAGMPAAAAWLYRVLPVVVALNNQNKGACHYTPLETNSIDYSAAKGVGPIAFCVRIGNL